MEEYAIIDNVDNPDNHDNHDNQESNKVIVIRPGDNSNMTEAIKEVLERRGYDPNDPDNSLKEIIVIDDGKVDKEALKKLGKSITDLQSFAFPQSHLYEREIENVFELQNIVDDFRYINNPITKKMRNANYQPIRNSEKNPKIHRNDFCPCGSGKKYKNCCNRK